MIEKYDSREPITFESRIKELMDFKEEISKKRELLKKEFQEAIKQDKDSPELYREYCVRSEEYKKQMNEYDDKINILISKRDKIRNMPIYSKTSEYQDKQLEGDDVYEYLKRKNDKELMEKLKERRMSFDEYMTILYTELKDKPESTEDLIEDFMERFSSGTAVLEVKVGQKGNGRGIKTINSDGKFETEIGEEYILTRLSRYFMKTQKVTLDDLKKNIEFPEGVRISEPKDSEIKFECGNMKGTIKIKFTIQESETTASNSEISSQTDSIDSNSSDSATESREKLSEKEASPKQLFDSLEQYVKGRVGGDLSSADVRDIEATLELLKEEETYKQFCEMSKGEKVLNDPEINFPSNFEDFLNIIAPIKLNEKQLIAILRSNYGKKGENGGVLIFDANGFEVLKNIKNVSDPQLINKYNILIEKYRKRLDYNRGGVSTPQELINEIYSIEREIIDEYYPHLKNVYIK